MISLILCLFLENPNHIMWELPAPLEDQNIDNVLLAKDVPNGSAVYFRVS